MLEKKKVIEMYYQNVVEYKRRGHLEVIMEVIDLLYENLKNTKFEVSNFRFKRAPEAYFLKQNSYMLTPSPPS